MVIVKQDMSHVAHCNNSILYLNMPAGGVVGPTFCIIFLGIVMVKCYWSWSIEFASRTAKGKEAVHMVLLFLCNLGHQTPSNLSQ